MAAGTWASHQRHLSTEKNVPFRFNKPALTVTPYLLHPNQNLLLRNSNRIVRLGSAGRSVHSANWFWRVLS
jgi:hypothetical protein